MAYEDPDAAATDPGPVDGALPTNEKAYIIPAQDAKGHSVRLYCRAIPAAGRIVADIHASRKYPFRTYGDLIRWCVVTGCRRLAANAGIPSVMAQADTMIAILQDEEFQIQFAEYFTAMKRVVDHYLDARAAGEARRVVAHARAELEKMPEGYWKARYREELLTRYSTLLDIQDAARSQWVTAGNDDDDGIEIDDEDSGTPA